MADIRIQKREAGHLRMLAASLGLVIRRGIGAGEVGNISELMEEIADAYEIDPDAVIALVRQIRQINRDKDARDIETMIKEKGAIIL
jgi:hypothetical protein